MKKLLTSFVLLFTLAGYTQGVFGPGSNLIPSGPYAIVWQENIKGGLHVLTDTNLLPTYLRDSAMVYQKSDSAFYVWSGTRWLSTNIGGPILRATKALIDSAIYVDDSLYLGRFNDESLGFTDSDVQPIVSGTNRRNTLLGAGFLIPSTMSIFQENVFIGRRAIDNTLTSAETSVVIGVSPFNGGQKVRNSVLQGWAVAASSDTIENSVAIGHQAARINNNLRSSTILGNTALAAGSNIGVFDTVKNTIALTNGSILNSNNFTTPTDIDGSLIIGGYPEGLTSSITPLTNGVLKNTVYLADGNRQRFYTRSHNSVHRIYDTTGAKVLEIDSLNRYQFTGNAKDASNQVLQSEEALVSNGTIMTARNINKVQDGATFFRPSNPQSAQLYFDNDLQKLLIYSGSQWLQIESNPVTVADTFYVRPSGGTYGTEDGTSYANAWDGLSNINFSLLENNVLAICGTHNEVVSVTANNFTITGNAPEESGTIDGQDARGTGMQLNTQFNVVINNLSIINHTTQNLFIGGKSSGIITNNCTFSGSGNQGIQHFNYASATHNNVICDDNLDEGISAHDTTIVYINGGTFTNGGNGINTVHSSTIYIAGNPTFSGNTDEDIWVANSDSDSSNKVIIKNSTIGEIKATVNSKVRLINSTVSTVNIDGSFLESAASVLNSVDIDETSTGIFNSCLITWAGVSINGSLQLNKCRVLNDARVIGGIFKARHTLFSGGDDAQLDFESNSTADIAYCVFTGMPSADFGVSFRTGTTITNFQNCTFVGTGSNVGRGHFAQEPNTTYNHIFTNLSIGAFQSTGAQTLNNCAFFNNSSAKNGTFTNNNEVTTDPLIVDAANLDFSLGAGSSCLNTGATLTLAEGILSADWGNGTTETPVVITINQTGAWDIGAYVQ